MMGSEGNFQEWFKKNFPCLVLEDWRVENKLLPKQQRLEIERWQKEGISSPPDFKIHWVTGIKYLCWVDVKWTSKIENPFNLNWGKYSNYVSVSEKTYLPVYIVLFTGEPCENNPRAWGYIDPNGNEKIPLKDIHTFSGEIKTIKIKKGAFVK